MFDVIWFDLMQDASFCSPVYSECEMHIRQPIRIQVKKVKSWERKKKKKTQRLPMPEMYKIQ